VHDWLTGQGLTITATTPHYVAVTTTVAQADTAFDTQIEDYQSAFFGDTVDQAIAVGGISVPAPLAGDIASVTGYTPNQPRSAYGVTGSQYTGQGATIAVVLDGDSSTELADANQYCAAPERSATSCRWTRRTRLPSSVARSTSVASPTISPPSARTRPRPWHPATTT
jgi:subtilase family serine protease